MGEESPDARGPSVPFRIYSRTDVGKRRQRNEDSLGVIVRHGIFVVADGMGGVDGGDFCSRLVVDRLARDFEFLKPDEISYRDKLDLIEKSIGESSAMIKEEAADRGISGMGTTVVLICFNLESLRDACIMHVGDSRVYRRRRRNLEKLTLDHSMAAESGISDGAMIPIFMAGVITRAVGVRADVEVERTPSDVRKGDMFLLCSDGLYNMVPEQHMSILLDRDTGDPAADLVNTANDAGGFDNITVILIEVLGGGEDGQGNLEETAT